MTNLFRAQDKAIRGIALLGALSISSLAGCKLDVTNPGVIDANKFNPLTDGATISLSAQTQFYTAFQNIVLQGGNFAEEEMSGAAAPDGVDIGRRNFTSVNQVINQSIFGPLSQAIATNETVIKSLQGEPGAASDINIARAEMNLGFSLDLMAETFCQGTVLVGPALPPKQLLDSAVTRFNQAIAVASAASGAEASKIVNASKIGLARAYLQNGDNANAATSAAAVLGSVPSSFAYNVITIDDPGNRGLGNLIYANTVPTRILVVPAPYRALNDPRVPWVDAGKKAQDNILEDYQQQKYTGYATPLRIASYLEAQYVQAEASLNTGDPTAALALIATRRAAGGQGAFTGTGTPAILSELLNQAARDFWLEGKKLGDWRRNPSAEPFISAAGAPYKGTLAFGTLTCVPIPQEEINANPNLKP